MAKKPDLKSLFEEELYFKIKTQRDRAYLVAVIASCSTLFLVLCLLLLLPLKQVVPFVAMVDRSTGRVERMVEIPATSLDQLDAVKESELTRYVSAREAYDPYDNNNRINTVLKLSQDQAAASLRQLWQEANPNYPISVYGTNRVEVRIVSVTLSPEPSRADPNIQLATVRLSKTLIEPGLDETERKFIASIGYTLQPRTERNIEDVWENPFGFTVLNYRLDPETLE